MVCRCEHVYFLSHEQRASEWQTGFHGLKFRERPEALLPDETRESGKGNNCNWEVYKGQCRQQLLSFAEQLFTMPREEFLSMRASAWRYWRYWKDNLQSFFCSTATVYKGQLRCDRVDKVQAGLCLRGLYRGERLARRGSPHLQGGGARDRGEQLLSAEAAGETCDPWGSSR